MIGIYCNQRQFCDHFNALAKNIFRRNIFWFGIIGVQSENTSLHCIHDITVGSFHNNVTHKTSGQSFKVFHDIFEYFHIFIWRKSSEQKQIDGFFKTKFTSLKTIYDIIYIISLIIQSSMCRDLTSINKIVTCYIWNLGKPCQDTFTCGVTQASFYIIFYIQIRVDPVTIHQFFPKQFHTVFQIAHLFKIQHLMICHLLSSSISISILQRISGRCIYSFARIHAFMRY